MKRPELQHVQAFESITAAREAHELPSLLDDPAGTIGYSHIQVVVVIQVVWPSRRALTRSASLGPVHVADCKT